MTLRFYICAALIALPQAIHAGEPGDDNAYVKQLIDELDSDDDFDAGRAMVQLRDLGAKAVPALIDALGSKNDNRALNSAWVLGEIGKPAIPSIIATLKKGSSRQRGFAAHAFTYLKVERKSVVPALCEALSDSDSQARQSIMRALSHSEDARAVAPVVRIVTSNATEEERLTGLATLANLGELAGAAAPQLMALHDSVTADELDKAWPRALCNALALIGKDSIPLVAARISNRKINSTRRVKLIYVLDDMTQFHDRDKLKPAVPTLVRLLNDNSRDVRTASVIALGRIGKAAAPAAEAVRQYAVNESGAGRAAGAYALYRINPSAKGDAIRILTKAISEKPAQERLTAIRWLSEMKGDAASAVADLTKALRDTDPEVRCEACAALGRIGRPANAALVELQRVAKEDPDADVRNAAKTAIQSIPTALNSK